MSTSMRLYVERREGDRWVFLPVPDRESDSERRLPPDWYSPNQSYDEMAVICGMRNSDGFKPIVPVRGNPAEPSSELAEALDFYDFPEGTVTWLLLSELESYDFDQTVVKMVRTYSSDELAQLGWLGNGDGTPYDDVQRHLSGHEAERQRADGYQERPIVVGSQVRHLLERVELIRATAGVPSDQIRLTACFF